MSKESDEEACAEVIRGATALQAVVYEILDAQMGGATARWALGIVFDKLERHVARLRRPSNDEL